MTLIKTSRCAFLAATTFLVVANASAVDDSVWINQEIKSAILTGQTEYRIPAGTYTIENPIIIPDGTSNFTLRGAGMEETTITTPNKKLNYAVGVGVITMCHNNWGLTNRPNSLVANSKTGASSLLILAGQTPPQPGYYVLWDQNQVIRIGADANSMNHAEVVKVLSYNPVTRLATLDCPIGREYDVNPRLSDLRAAICTNVAVSDLGFDGTAPAGTFTTSFVSAGISDGLVLARLKVTNYVTNAISTNIARNVLVEGTNVDGATAVGPGGGYGVAIYRSRFVTINNCVDTNARHSYIMHSGTMDVLVQGCSTGVGGYDLHGYDERRITFRNCTGNGINIGNDAFLAGARDIRVDSCTFEGGGIDVHPNVRNVYVTNSSMTGVGFYYTKPGTNKGSPSGGFADGVLFQNCTIRGSAGNGLFGESTVVGNVSFINCKFEYKLPSGGILMRARTWQQATFNFSGCEFLSQSGWFLMELSCPGPKFVLNLRNCDFKSMRGTQYAIRVNSGFTGKATLLNNRFFSLGGTNLKFVSDDTKRLGSIGTSNSLFSKMP